MDWNALWDRLLGPEGVAVGAIIIVVILWRDHTRRDHLVEATNKELTDAVSKIPGALADLTAVVRDAVDRELSRSPDTRTRRTDRR